MVLDARLRLLLFLAGLFVTSLIVGNIIGGKLYQADIGGWVLTISVGMIPFPIVFSVTDVINDFYGRRAARLVTFVGFVMDAFTILVITVAVHVPWAPFTRDADWAGVTPGTFDNIFASSQRILIASAIAYLVATLLDIRIFHVLKRLTAGKHLWLRATGSTVISQGMDTVIIQFLAWYGILPLSDILSIIATSYLLKVVIAVALTPVLYAAHAVVEGKLGLHPLPVAEDP